MDLVESGSHNDLDLEKDLSRSKGASNAPHDPMYRGYMIIDGLPLGDFALLALNAVVSLGLPIVGFLVCYLVHQSHAAKYGSVIGLGLTFVLYGFSIHPSYSDGSIVSAGALGDEHLNLSEPVSSGSSLADLIDRYIAEFLLLIKFSKLLETTNNTYVASAVIGCGVVLLLWSGYGFVRVKAAEHRLLART